MSHWNLHERLVKIFLIAAKKLPVVLSKPIFARMQTAMLFYCHRLLIMDKPLAPADLGKTKGSGL